jgi:hypothetical protein
MEPASKCRPEENPARAEVQWLNKRSYEPDPRSTHSRLLSPHVKVALSLRTVNALRNSMWPIILSLDAYHASEFDGDHMCTLLQKDESFHEAYRLVVAMMHAWRAHSHVLVVDLSDQPPHALPTLIRFSSSTHSTQTRVCFFLAIEAQYVCGDTSAAAWRAKDPKMCRLRIHHTHPMEDVSCVAEAVTSPPRVDRAWIESVLRYVKVWKGAFFTTLLLTVLQEKVCVLELVCETQRIECTFSHTIVCPDALDAYEEYHRMELRSPRTP